MATGVLPEVQSGEARVVPLHLRLPGQDHLPDRRDDGAQR